MSVRTSLLIGNDPLVGVHVPSSVQLGTNPADSSLIKVLVLDFSCIPIMDTVATQTLTQLYFELQEDGIRVFLTCVNGSLRGVQMWQLRVETSWNWRASSSASLAARSSRR